MTNNLPNKPNSIMDVLTTQSNVVFEMINAFKYELNDIAFVYEPSMTLDTAISKWLNENPHSSANTIPIFIFSRTVTNFGDRGLQRRSNVSNGKLKLDSGEVLTYDMYQGEFLFNFMFVTHDMESIERFEVSYYSEAGISATKEVKVNIPQVGDFSYFLEYNDLDEITINREGVVHNAIIGSIKVRGFYFSLAGRYSTINEIRSRILTYNIDSNGEKIIKEILVNDLTQGS